VPIDRTWYDTLVDDSGDGISGSVWDKADVDALLDAIDALITEGTFVPVLTGSGGGSGQTYATQIGHYVKVGQLVHIQAYIALTNKGTITSNAILTGLPFNANVVANNFSGVDVPYFFGFTNAKVRVSGLVVPNTATINLYAIGGAATGMSTLVGADLSNTSEFVVSGTYRASA
jgi:hypothetical protein